MEKTENSIVDGVIWKQLLLFFFPILIGTFFQQLYNTVDTVVVGQYVGKEALAAVGTTGTVINLLVGFFVGVSSGATVIVSQFFGAEDRENVSKAVHTSMALAIVGGVVIMVSACSDGHGGQAFYDTFAQGDSPSEILRAIRAVPATQTRPDQWQSQILARVMENHRVILVSRQPRELVARMGLLAAGSLEEAIRMADQLLGSPQPLTVVPDGVGTITVETWQRRKISSRFKVKEE